MLLFKKHVLFYNKNNALQLILTHHLPEYEAHFYSCLNSNIAYCILSG